MAVAEARLREARELTPGEAMENGRGWHDLYFDTQNVPGASLEDLGWADMCIF